MQHDAVVGQAVHEESAIAAIGGVHYAALEQGVAEPLAPARSVDAQPQFRCLRLAIEREVRDTGEGKVGRLHAENAVLLEVDAIDVSLDRLVLDRIAEAQHAICRAQLEKMP